MTIIATVGILAIGLTATTMHPTQVQSSGPSACPDQDNARVTLHQVL